VLPATVNPGRVVSESVFGVMLLKSWKNTVAADALVAKVRAAIATSPANLTLFAILKIPSVRSNLPN
jgi:hypothetical protein